MITAAATLIYLGGGRSREKNYNPVGTVQPVWCGQAIRLAGTGTACTI